jgi:hypothetical protein
VPRHQSSRSSKDVDVILCEARDLPAGCSAWHDETGYDYDLGVLTGLVQVVIVGFLCTSPYCTWNERDQRVSIRESPKVISPEGRSRKPKYTDAVNLSSVQVDLKIQRSGWLPSMVIFSHWNHYYCHPSVCLLLHFFFPSLPFLFEASIPSSFPVFV